MRSLTDAAQAFLNGSSWASEVEADETVGVLDKHIAAFKENSGFVGEELGQVDVGGEVGA